MDTLTWMLAEAGTARPDSLFVRFCERRSEVTTLNYLQVWVLACRWAKGLAEHGVRRGDRVVLALPNCEDFVGAFFGTLLAGGIPAALPPLKTLEGDHPSVVSLARRIAFVGARALVVAKTQVGPAALFSPAETDGVSVITSLDLPENADFVAPENRPDEVALLQFTSGTAGPTKVVQLTHSELMAQISGISKALALVTGRDSAVSWLPLFHDMGLIGFLLTPAFSCCHVTLLRTEDFAVRPGLWVQALSDTRATITGGPPSAYALCARRVRERDAANLDLSALRVALVGAEMVSPSSLDAFAARFAPCGFRPTSLMPTYGLAENCLAVTIPPLDRGARFDRVDLDQIEERGVAASPVGTTARERAFASVGRPLPGVKVAVVDECGNGIEDSHVGEIAVSGPTVMRGYLHQPEITREVIRDGWLRTGDLGYFKDGELYITGRRKEVLIVGGRNYYPEDLESVVKGVDGVRAGRAVAVSVDGAESETEAIVILAETGLTDIPGRDRLRRDIRSSLGQAGFPVDRVVLLPRRSIRTTASGKLMRLEARARYLAGRLGEEIPTTP
jgi:acyl-CoA synthetase (AMP-forming)/AMP-acid ligase II